jgi:RNA polymerase sigma factor (sigma-70 family)
MKPVTAPPRAETSGWSAPARGEPSANGAAREGPHWSPEDAGDEALLMAAGRRDPVAMGLLFDRHQVGVRRFLCRMEGGGPDIDDLVHSTFIEAFRAAPRFRAAASVRSWLLGIALNVSRHHARAEIRRRAFLRSLASQPTASATRPDLFVENRQLVDRLQHRLGQLTHQRRAAFVLCDLEDCSGAEAAQALAARPGTVGRWLHEARTALREALEEGTS